MENLLSFPDSSRVWIYQADRTLSEQESREVNRSVKEFASQWTSHNNQLSATGGLLHGRFLILLVNEFHAGVSGCSIDASMHFVKEMGEKYSTDFTGRMQFAYIKDAEIHTLHKNDLRDRYSSGEISDDTLFFDNLVQTKDQFINQWVVPLSESWMKRFV